MVLWNEHLLNFSDETDWCWRLGEILSPMSFRGYSKHPTFFPAVFKTLSLLLRNLRCAFVLFPSCFLYLEFIDFLDLWNYSSSDCKHFSHYFLKSIFSFTSCLFFFLNSSYTCDSPLEVVLQLTNDTFTFFIVFTHCFILGRFYCCVFKSTNLFLLKSLLCFQSKQACFMSDKFNLFFGIIYVSLFNMFIISPFVLECRTVTVTV